MTDQSRRGTVARAIELRADGLFAYRDSHHGIDPQTWQQIAKAAIDANDAFLWNKARKNHWGRDAFLHLDFLLDESSLEEPNQ